MRNLNVLVVEDEVLIGLGLEQSLIKLGYQVNAIVSTGGQAIEMVKNEQPDIILMDIRLQGELDGVETAEIIQSQFDIPIIFQTAYAEESIIIKAKKTWAFRYLIKPVREQELKIALEMALYTAKINTDRKQVDEELRKRSLAVMHSGSIFIITDLKGVIEFVNPSFTRITGYSSQEAIGKNIKILKSGKHSKSFYKNLWDTVLSGETWKGEMINQKKCGELYWEFTTISPVKNRDEKITHFVVIKEDISERKEMENQLLTAKKLAESANKAKSEFFAQMNHEIRTPMNGIIGMIDVLLDSDLSGEQRESAQIAKTSASHLLSLVNDNLDYAKFEAKKLVLEKLEFDLRDLVETIIDIESQQVKTKNLEFLNDIHPVVPVHLIGDPTRLKQILINLISNAIKFTERGTISFQIFLQSEDDSKVVLRFEIKDTGIGISKSQQQHLFKLYTQVDESTSRKFGGTGLGLAICKQLVDLMEGNIGVESVENKGTSFWFTVTFDKQKASKAGEQDSFPNINKSKVLIVDHSQISASFIVRQLEYNGVSCQTINKVEDVLPMLKSGVETGNPYQIVIIDMNIGDSFESVARSIKKSDLTKNTQLVLLSSFGHKGEAVQAKQAGFSAYLPKPYKLFILLRCLDYLLVDIKNGSWLDHHDIMTQYSLREERQRKEIKTHNNFQVLLVDDSVVNQKVACHNLKKLGYKITVANNGKECLAILEQKPIDLILMDCQMPIMDGYQATENIRRSSAAKINSKIPIIALTANNSEGSREECLQKGMDDFIIKPFVFNEMADILKKWLPDIRTKNEALEKPKLNVESNSQEKTYVFNKAIVMERLMDNMDIVKTVIEAFLMETPEQIKILIKHMDAAKYSEMRHQVHAIKGAAGNIGAEELYATLLDMEQTESIETIRDKIPALKESFQKLEIILKKEI